MLNFIVNTRSGKGRGNKTLRKIINYCFSNNIEYTIHITSEPMHATAIAKSLSLAGATTIVAVGGDGTFHEVLNGIVDLEKTALGLIPAGRGNDYARAAKLSKDPIRALKDIINNETLMTDYIQIGDKKCLNIAGTGHDVNVLQHVAGRTGKITYLVSLIHCIKHFVPYTFTVKIGCGETEYTNCAMIAVANGTCIGGGMKISPHSDINDGKLNLIILEVPEDGKLMPVLTKFLKGKHIDKEFTTQILCDEVHISSKDNYPIQIDGEIYENMELDCHIIKGGLKTFKPS